MGLTLKLHADVANYYCSSTSSSGFKVLLHSPIETPKVANFGFFVAPGLETKVVISPKISEASQLIRNVPIQQRQCVFANEANLSYYKIYSRKNCEWILEIVNWGSVRRDNFQVKWNAARKQQRKNATVPCIGCHENTLMAVEKFVTGKKRFATRKFCTTSHILHRKNIHVVIACLRALK